MHTLCIWRCTSLAHYDLMFDRFPVSVLARGRRRTLASATPVEVSLAQWMILHFLSNPEASPRVPIEGVPGDWPTYLLTLTDLSQLRHGVAQPGTARSHVLAQRLAPLTRERRKNAVHSARATKTTRWLKQPTCRFSTDQIKTGQQGFKYQSTFASSAFSSTCIHFPLYALRLHRGESFIVRARVCVYMFSGTKLCTAYFSTHLKVASLTPAWQRAAHARCWIIHTDPSALLDLYCYNMKTLWKGHSTQWRTVRSRSFK